MTRKHKILTDTSDFTTFTTFLFKCDCGKEYKHRQSLNNHKKKCNYVKEEQEETNSIEIAKVEEKREPIIDGEPMTAREKMLLDIIDQQNKVAEQNLKMHEDNMKLQEQNLKFQEEQNKMNKTYCCC